MAAFSAIAVGAQKAAEEPRFFSMLIFLMVDDAQPRDHWANTELNFSGLKSACEMLDASLSKSTGKPAKFPLTIVLFDLPNNPGIVEFLEARKEAGNQIGVQRLEVIPKVAAGFGIAANEITLLGANWDNGAKPERTAREVQADIRTAFHAVLKGDSLIGETIDLGHNFEGRPFFPYYVQIRPDQPWLSALTNRELQEQNAFLDLLWLTRTPWSDYDRYCFAYSFHLGDVQLAAEPRVRPGNIWFWKNEVQQWEKNLEAGNIPYAHLSIAMWKYLSRSKWFVKGVRVIGVLTPSCLGG